MRRNRIVGAARIFMLFLALVASYSISAAASELVVICRLTQVKKWSVNSLASDELFQKAQPIDQEFVLKFDDVEKRVTYVGGEGIMVIPQPDFKDRFDNEIIFQGDGFPLAPEGIFLRYSGEISRLTGRVTMRTTWLRASDGRRDPSRLQEEATGTCTAGPRKF
jgi:hypothetical protein